MKTALLHLLVLLAVSLAPLHAAEDQRTARLRAADDQRVAALLGGDRTALAGIFSDDLRYAHSSGVVDDKAGYLAALASGKLKYLGMEYEERAFTFPAPGVALMHGRSKVKVGKADGTAEMVLQFLAVWREEQGQWRFLAWQSCKLPDAAAPAAK